LAQLVNEQNLSWTADPYVSAEAGSSTLAQTQASSHDEKFADGTESFNSALKLAQKFLQVDLKTLDIEQLEPEWNWQDVMGYDFTGRQLDQGHCGSCYLLATNSALESRVKIWFGKQIDISVQHRLDCSFVNEGCHGGWGYFDGLFLENYGAVEE